MSQKIYSCDMCAIKSTTQIPCEHPFCEMVKLLPAEENTGAHSYTESAYKEGESSDQETECKEVDCNCQPGICLRSVREICATEYTEAIEKASSNANMITEKLYRYLRGNPDATHIDFRDFFIKELNDISAPSESQPDIFYGYLEEGVYGEFRHVPEPSPNKDKIGFIFGGKRYEFSRLAEPNKNKPESQEEMWHSWEEGAELGNEVDVMLYDGSILKNCIPQTDGDFYYKPFDRFFDIAAVKQWKYSFENLYD